MITNLVKLIEFIDFRELKILIKNMGLKKSKAEIKAIFREIDSDGSSNLDFEEFKNLMQNYLVDLIVNQRLYLRRAFKLLRSNQHYN